MSTRQTLSEFLSGMAAALGIVGDGFLGRLSFW